MSHLRANHLGRRGAMLGRRYFSGSGFPIVAKRGSARRGLSRRGWRNDRFVATFRSSNAVAVMRQGLDDRGHGLPAAGTDD